MIRISQLYKNHGLKKESIEIYNKMKQFMHPDDIL